MQRFFWRLNVVFFCFISFIFVNSVFAGRGRSLTPESQSSQITKGKSDIEVTVKKITGVGNEALQDTPEYDNNAHERSNRRKRWGKISVEYETEEDWLDIIEFKYYALVQNPDTKAYYFFPGEVAYINVPEGKHISTIFLHPNTLERYGEIKRIAVEVLADGNLVSEVSKPVSKQRWWRLVTGQPQVTTKRGFLLKRENTPWRLVAVDNFPQTESP
jgi:hypothetical protein